MIVKLFFPLLMGTFLVFQPGINRQIMASKGLGFAIVLNGCVVFFLTTSFFLLAFFWGDRLPDFFRFKTGGAIQWWFVLPGLLGFSLVACVPFILASVGALSTVVGMLAGQLLTSLAWDAFLEGRPPSAMRVIGMCLAMGGALLTQMETK